MADPYVSLARKTIEEYVRTGKVTGVPEGIPGELSSRRAGVFVTLHKDGELRGCIGTYLPTRKNIAEEIIQSAVAACSEDYRFAPVAPEELPGLRYEVSILSEPVEMRDFKRHDPKSHGVLVRTGDGRSGLLLPDLEGMDTAEAQLAIACRKGGIGREEKGLRILEFKVEKHG